MQTNEIQVTIDNDFARFGAKSYAINKINSVEIKKRHPNGQGMAFVVSVVAVLLFAGGIAVAAFLIALFAGWLWWRSRFVEYELHLTTSSSEIAALKNSNFDFIADLRDRIEAAMARRAAKDE